ncbi:MAG: phage baseplate assembly protein V, partial [Caldilinea sp.]|nr:phage baseplate assembly protein V [Caldilinea sp.]
ELGYGNESSRVFTGRVQSVDAGLSQIHIEALSDFSALIKARVNLVYKKQTAGAIVENLLGRFNIEKSKVEPGINFPSYTLSAGRTAWANLRQLAEQCGFDFYADVQDQAVFAAYRPAKTHEFQYGSHILDYTWASLADAFVGVEVCGESPSGQGQGNDASVWLTKKEVKGTAGRTRGKVLRLVDPTARTPSMAREIAGNQWQRYKAQAKGQLSLLGTPEVGLGDAIQLSKTPPAHRGQLRVTGVRHRLNMESIVGVMKRVAEQEVQRILTTELGIVTAVFPHSDENDKDNYHCSVKLKQHKRPDGQALELRNVPVATPYMGLVCIPNINDLVLVNFIGGDINAPIVTGRLYNDADRPPQNKKNEFLLQHKLDAGGSIKLDNKGRILAASKNEKETLTLDDDQIELVADAFSLVIDAKAKKITVRSDKKKEGGSIKLDDKGVITATSKNEKNTVTVKDEQIALVTEKLSLIIDVKGEKIVIHSDKDVELNAKQGKLTLSAREVEIKADTHMKLTAQQNIDLKATSQCTVEGTAGATLKNAAAQVALNGPSVNINNGALEIT